MIHTCNTLPYATCWACYHEKDKAIDAQLQRQTRKYKYRNNPCDIAEHPWCVQGEDKITSSAGVLEWCWDENDAKQMMEKMLQTDEFADLSIYKWQEPGYKYLQW